MATELHPDCAPLALLVGTWDGAGRGSYPTIDSFEYREQVTFGHNGKPFLMYSQRTWSPSDGRPLHSETGYFRPKSDGRVEVVMAHPTGVIEIEEGTFDGRTLLLETKSIGLTSSAVRVDAVTRTLVVAGDVLRYTVAMSAVGIPFTHHLSAELHRSAA